MSIRTLAPLAFSLVLAACSGNSLNNGTPDDGTGGGDGDGDGGESQLVVPAEVARNLRAISYDPAGKGTLTVDMDGLVGSPQGVKFVRTAKLDIEGYEAFTYQETNLQRSHLALVSVNKRGNLQAGVVADGGQFGRHFGGGHFARIDVYTPPTIKPGVETGQFSYAGTYAGVFVTGPTEETNVNAGLPDLILPGHNYRTTGTALINASFANNKVNGGVGNRELLDDKGRKVLDLAAINFPATDIDAEGQFLGAVEFTEDNSSAGSVAGIFGGKGASDVAGAIVINPIPGEDGIWEYGTFNLPRCDLAGSSPLCIPR